MSDGSQSVFRVPMNRLRDWKRGDRITAAHLQESVDAIRDVRRGVHSGRQVKPNGGGGTQVIRGGRAVVPQYGSLWHLAFNGAEHMDTLLVSPFDVSTSSWSSWLWYIMKPPVLWRSIDEWTEANPNIVNNRQHIYLSHTRRRVNVYLEPSIVETQVIIPRYRAEFPITAQPALIYTDGRERVRSGVELSLTNELPDYAIVTLYANTGTGDELPDFETYATIHIDYGGRSIIGQIRQPYTGNPVVNIQPYHAFVSGENVEVTVRWSWRWQSVADGRAWTKEY